MTFPYLELAFAALALHTATLIILLIVARRFIRAVRALQNAVMTINARTKTPPAAAAVQQPVIGAWERNRKQLLRG